jgi:hypothetical protein
VESCPLFCNLDSMCLFSLLLTFTSLLSLSLFFFFFFAVDISKGIVSATAVPSTLSAANVATTGGNALTQVLVAIYCFLAGALVATSRALWMLPLATAASAAAFSGVGALSSRMLPFYKALNPDKAAVWTLDVTRLIFAVITAAMAITHVVSDPGALLLHRDAAASPAAAPGFLPQAIVASSAGFCGFVLWAEVAGRLYKRGQGYLAVLHYALMLCLLCAAAYKSVHVPFLAATLLSEANSAFHLAARAAEAAGAGPGSKLLGALQTVDRATFWTLRVGLHALMGLTVLFSPAAFPAPAYYGMGCAGMLHMNLANARRATLMMGRGAGDKVHSD